MPINKQKYQLYKSLQSDPALALMKMFKEHKSEMENYFEEHEKKMEDMMTQCEAEMKSKMAEYEKSMGETMAAKIENIIQEKIGQNILKGISQIKGEKGDSVKGDKGDSVKGDNGYTPIKGKDYFDGKSGKSIIGPPGKNGEPGKTPQKGADYFTPTEIEEFKEEIKDMLNLEEILKEIKELKKSIENMQKVGQLGGRTLHRGGISLIWNENVGTGNGTTLAFDLDNTPYSSSELQVWVGGGIQFLTDDFTLSGKTLNFLVAPPDGSTIRATYRRS